MCPEPLRNLAELWDAFERDTQKCTEESNKQSRRSRNCCAACEAPGNTEESHAARFVWDVNQYKPLSYMSRALLRTGKEDVLVSFKCKILSLPLLGVRAASPDPPMNGITSFLAERVEAVSRLRTRRQQGIATCWE